MVSTKLCQMTNVKNENMGKNAHRWRNGRLGCRYRGGETFPIVKNGTRTMPKSQITYWKSLGSVDI